MLFINRAEEMKFLPRKNGMYEQNVENCCCWKQKKPESLDKDKTSLQNRLISFFVIHKSVC